MPGEGVSGSGKNILVFSAGKDLGGMYVHKGEVILLGGMGL